jgi:hypothetical protein
MGNGCVSCGMSPRVRRRWRAWRWPRLWIGRRMAVWDCVVGFYGEVQKVLSCLGRKPLEQEQQYLAVDERYRVASHRSLGFVRETTSGH